MSRPWPAESLAQSEWEYESNWDNACLLAVRLLKSSFDRDQPPLQFLDRAHAVLLGEMRQRDQGSAAVYSRDGEALKDGLMEMYML